MVRPVYIIRYIDQKLNCVDTGKLRVEVDKNLESTYSIVQQQVARI